MINLGLGNISIKTSNSKHQTFGTIIEELVPFNIWVYMTILGQVLKSQKKGKIKNLKNKWLFFHYLNLSMILTILV